MNIHSEDTRLVENILEGNKNAFLFLVRKHQRLVYHILYRMIPNKSDHEDLGQDVFLKVYSKLNTFKGEAKLSTWIARITYNTCLNYLEKKKFSLMDDMIKPIDPDEENSTMMEQVSDEDITPDFATELNTNKKIIRDNIERLPATFKLIITLYHLEEMKYKEITEITNLPEGTVKSYLFRARKMLKDLLVENYKVEDLCL